MYLSNYTLGGNLTRDAETRQAGTQTVTSFGVALNPPARGGQEPPTMFFNCSLWGQRGEKLAQYLTKGTPVVITGELTVREYMDKEGVKKTTFEVSVQDLAFAGSSGVREETGEASVNDDDVPF